MKDIDKLLQSSSGPVPKRSLTSNFTQGTLARLNEIPTRRPKFIARLFGHRPLVAAALSIVAVAAIGGVAYGVTNGFSFLNALFVSETKLTNNERLLTIDTSDCAAGWLDAKSGNFTADDQTLYYRLNESATITAEQMTRMVQGNCESEADFQGRFMDTRSRVEAAHPEIAYDSINTGFRTNVIKAISAESLTIVTDESTVDGKNEVVETEYITRVYRTIAKDAIVVGEAGQALQWSDLKVGDYVSVIFSYPVEGIPRPSDLKRDTSKSVVLAVLKTPSNIVTYDLEYTPAYGVQFRQVKPCADDPTGYCDIFSE